MDTPESLPHVLFAGGGTGGHLYPGLALAKALQARAGRIWITFVGTAHGLDAELAPAAGFPLYTVPAGRGSPLSLRRPWNAVRFVQSVTACRRIFRMRPPDVVVGLGGFAAAPAGLAARWAGVPLVLLEQNVLPGRVTRLLSRWAAEIHLQFDEARTRLPRARGAVLHSGSPLRAELAALADGPPVDGDRLLVMGGSQGARRLNELVCAGVPSLIRSEVALTHLAGRRDFDFVRSAYAGVPSEAAEVRAYADDMADLYRRTRLGLCRAGAMTLAEFAAAGLPAVLVPYPAARDDHQTVNAEVVARAGAAVVLPEADLSPERVCEEILGLWLDAERLRAMGQAMRTFARPDAADRIAEHVLTLVGRRRGGGGRG